MAEWHDFTSWALGIVKKHGSNANNDDFSPAAVEEIESSVPAPSTPDLLTPGGKPQTKFESEYQGTFNVTNSDILPGGTAVMVGELDHVTLKNTSHVDSPKAEVYELGPMGVVRCWVPGKADYPTIKKVAQEGGEHHKHEPHGGGELLTQNSKKGTPTIEETHTPETKNSEYTREKTLSPSISGKVPPSTSPSCLSVPVVHITASGFSGEGDTWWSNGAAYIRDVLREPSFALKVLVPQKPEPDTPLFEMGPVEMKAMAAPKLAIFEEETLADDHLAGVAKLPIASTEDLEE